MAMKTPFDGAFPPGLSEDAKQAALSALEAMADWRSEMTATTERQNARVAEKMAAAAKALGWPAEIVDATRSHMQAASKMQVEMMDQMMAVWKEQLRHPDPAAAVKSMMSRMSAGGLPGMMPGADGMANPMQFWMQVGEQWQKNWLSVLQSMSGGKK
jgi:hypothetical protein